MSQNQKHPTLGVVLVLTSSLLFGLNASTTKVLVHSGITPAQLVLFRSLAVMFIAAIIVAIRSPMSFKISLPEALKFVVYGVLGVGLMQWAYSNAVSNMQVGPALLVEYTAVVIVPLASWILFKEKVKLSLWIAVALVLIGLTVVAHPWNAWLSPVGAGWAFLAACLLSIYFIMGSRILRNRDAYSTLFYCFSTSSLFWLVVNLITQTPFVSFEGNVALTGTLSPISVPTWLMLTWVALAASFLPMLFTLLALHHLSAVGVGVVSTSETVFAFVFGYLWLSERIDVAQGVGAIIVIVGIVVAQMARSNKWQPSN